MSERTALPIGDELMATASGGKALRGIYQCLDDQQPNGRCEIVIRPFSDHRHAAPCVSLSASILHKKAIGSPPASLALPNYAGRTFTVNCFISSLKLSEQALKELKSIDGAILKSESITVIEQQCFKFMKTFGSHCNHGKLEFCTVSDIQEPPRSAKIDINSVSCDSVDELTADVEFDNGNKNSLNFQGSPPKCITNDQAGVTWDLLNGENEENIIGTWMLIPNHSEDLQHSDTIKKTMFQVWKQYCNLPGAVDNLEKIPQHVFYLYDFVTKDMNFLQPRTLEEVLNAVESCNQSLGDDRFWKHLLSTNQKIAQYLEIKIKEVTEPLPIRQAILATLLEPVAEIDFPKKQVLIDWLSNSLKRSCELQGSIQIIGDFLNQLQHETIPQMTLVKKLPSLRISPSYIIEQQGQDSVRQICTVSKEQFEKAVKDILHNLMSSKEFLDFLLLSAELLVCGFNFSSFQFPSERFDFNGLKALHQNLEENNCNLEMLSSKDEKRQFCVNVFLWCTEAVAVDEDRRKESITFVEKQLAEMDCKGILESCSVSSSLLAKLNLRNWYPNKITLADVMRSPVNCSDPKKLIELEHMPWRMLHHFITLDYNCRDDDLALHAKPSIKGDGDDDELLNWGNSADVDVISPLDVFVTIYNCCDLILKQTLLQKMQMCNLALPFLCPGKMLSASIWSLRSIVLEWQGDTGNGDNVKMGIERHLVEVEAPIISFLQLGRPAISKSKFAGRVLNKTEHPTFFHKDCKNGQHEKRLANGYVELASYVPDGKEDDRFPGVTHILNLRGDAAQLPSQRKLLEQISSVLVVFVEISSFSDEVHIAKMKEIFEDARNVVFVIHAPNTPSKQLMQGIHVQYTHATKEKKCNLKRVLTFTAQGPKNEESLREDLLEAIKKQAYGTTNSLQGQYPSILALKSNILQRRILVDEDNDACQHGHRLAENVKKELEQDIDSTPEKEFLFPLQHEPWTEWCRHKKDSYRKTNIDQGEAKKKMKAQRELQFEKCSTLPVFMKAAVDTFDKCDDKITLVFFIRWLNFLLESNALQNLPKLKLQRETLWLEREKEKAKMKSSGVEISTHAATDSNDQRDDSKVEGLKQRLDIVNERFSNNSIDIHNFIREMGQMYEAAIDNHKKPSPQLAEMPKRIAMLLCEGFPIELMHGESTSIPLIWIQAILKETHAIIKDKKLFVLSVLGVQSSGKSTLLNAMFGCALSVSAGQATRGAFMQLMPLPDPSVSGLKLDYVLVIDTEGLRAPELGFQKDNELAAMVIGLADLTLMNIKGENFADISDILQIAVHSFLRLPLVKSAQELRRKCVFVHQNVPAVNAKEKLRDGLQVLQDNLDTLTMDAAKVTGHEDIQSFCQVIDFDHQHHVWYLSDLWHGDPPMAPVNTGYSTVVQDVKKRTLKHVAHKHKTFTIQEICIRVKDLWNAVLSENFVFYFRNTLAVKFYQELETKMLEMCWKWEHLCQHQCAAEVDKAVTNSKTKQDLASAESQISKVIHTLFIDELEHQRTELTKFIDHHDHADIMNQWKEEKLQTLRSYFLRVKDKSLCVVSCKISQREFDVAEKTEENALQENMIEKANELAERTMLKMPTDKEIKDQFENIWKPWAEKVLQRQTPLEVDICKEMVTSLETYLFNNIPCLKTTLSIISLDQWSHAYSLQHVTLDDFKEGTHFFKKQHNQGYMSAEDARQKCIEQVKLIFFKLEQYLKSLGIEDINFAANCREVIQRVMVCITRINQDKYICIRLHPEFEVKLIVITASYACKVFKEILKEYEDRNGIYEKLEKFHEKMFAFYELKAKSCSAEVIATQLLEQQLSESVPNVVLENMTQTVVGELMIKFCMQKFHLIGEILTDLTEKDDFAQFALYIDDSATFAQQWIGKFINKEFFGEDNVYAKLAEVKCQRYVRLMIKNLDKIRHAFNEKKQGAISLDEILTELLKLSEDTDDLKKDKVTLGQLVKVTGHDVELSDPCHFVEMITKFLHELTEKSLEEHFLKVTSENVNWNGDPAFKQVFEKLWGCMDQCAFCHEPCMNTSEHAESEHRSLQHRPQAVRGIHEALTRTLIKTHCNQLVDSPEEFECQTVYPKCKVEEHTANYNSVHTYRDYKTYMERWDIAPSDEGNMFWQWFTYKYREQIQEKYNCTFGDNIEDWKDITQEEVLASLKEMRG